MGLNASMDATEHILWGAWVLGFALGPLAGWLVARAWPRLNVWSRQAILACCCLSIALGLCTIFASWTLRGFAANAINLGLAYISLTVLVWLAGRRAPGATAAMSSPSWLAVVGRIGFSLAAMVTIFISLIFAEDQIPMRETRLSPTLTARVYRKRFIQKDFDQMTVVYQPSWLPMMDRTIYSRDIKYWECTYASARVGRVANGDEVQVVCEDKILDRIQIP